MSILNHLDLHFFLIAMMGAITVRELLIIFLPDNIPAPLGWLLQVQEDA